MGNVIEEYDIGHKRGQEWWRRKEMHKEKGSTRKEIIETENILIYIRSKTVKLTEVIKMKNQNRSDEFDSAIKSIYRNDLAVFSRAINSSNNINETDPEGRTLLIYCILEKKADFIPILLSKGIDVNYQDNKDWSPLHYSAQGWNTNIAQMLINNKAIIDIVDENGNTPLWRSVYDSKGRGEMITLLIKNGADVDKKNINGVSPKDLAYKIANYNIKQFFEI